MKITAVKSLVVNAEMRNWVFVKVETDQAGLYGWGEASLEWKTRSVVPHALQHHCCPPRASVRQAMMSAMARRCDGGIAAP